jgi:hypothetical protein
MVDKISIHLQWGLHTLFFISSENTHWFLLAQEYCFIEDFMKLSRLDSIKDFGPKGERRAMGPSWG